ncbi:hypothetical protein [Cellulosimicrobium sp. NPDC057127]|uniref:hypothetical protein n=1 Tax=Cellulosimicrobium sp. NPDC057127 TaxID=3346026 RepID=UPI00362ADA02
MRRDFLSDWFWHLIESAIVDAEDPASSLTRRLSGLLDDDFRIFVDEFQLALRKLQPVAFRGIDVGQLDGDLRRSAEVLVIMQGRTSFDAVVRSGSFELELGPEMEDAQEVVDALEVAHESRLDAPFERGGTFPRGLIAAYPENPYGMAIGRLLEAAEGACARIEKSPELQQLLQVREGTDSVFLVIIFTPDESFSRMRRQEGEISAEFGYSISASATPESAVWMVAEAYDALARKFDLPPVSFS